MIERGDDAQVRIRRAGPDELGEVVAVCASALGWRPGDPHEALFRWKHEANPFGPSPTWVAERGGELVAVRTFLRWRFDTPSGPVAAVRAVDTATRPDHQGRGLFTRLTQHALPVLRDEGVGFVFNTPNDQSRPGYLQMGWQVVGRVPVALAVRGVRGVARLPQARVAADRWSLPCEVGVPASEALDDDTTVAELLAAAGGSRARLVTDRTPAFLRWRYAAGPVTYRALPLDGSVRDGLALFRRRTRGRSTEVVVADVIVPSGPGARDRRRALLDRLARDAGGDHLLAVADRRWEPPLVRVPRLGPLLTWRALTWEALPAPDDWGLCLGDVELF